MNKQVKYILFLVLLLATSLFAKPFSMVRVAKKEKISETAFSIDFAWVDENEYLGFEPGDLIELKKDKEIHTRHIYSPSKFPTDEDPTIQITVDKSVQESRIRHFYPRMSTGLSNAGIGDQNFKLRVLKTGLQQKLLERPLVMIAGGWAITRSIGIAKYLGTQDHNFLVIHSQHQGKASLHQDYLNELEKTNSYVRYLTGRGILRLNESLPDIPPYISQFIGRYGDKANYLLSGPDASSKNSGEFETSLAEFLEDSGIPKNQIFLSKWNDE